MPSLKQLLPRKLREYWVKKSLLRFCRKSLTEACDAHLARYETAFDSRPAGGHWAEQSDDLLALYSMTVFWSVYTLRVKESHYWTDEWSFMGELGRIEATVYALELEAKKCWTVPDATDRAHMMPAIIGKLAEISADKAVIKARLGA